MSLLSSLKKKYAIYTYYSPLQVLTREEAIVFHLINVSILSIGFYWTITIFPSIITHGIEKLFYYFTGKLVSLNKLEGMMITKQLLNKYTGSGQTVAFK